MRKSIGKARRVKNRRNTCVQLPPFPCANAPQSNADRAILRRAAVDDLDTANRAAFDDLDTALMDARIRRGR